MAYTNNFFGDFKWIKYLIGNLGKIIITDNIVKISNGKISYYDTTNDSSF